MTFDDWLVEGIEAGWCRPPVCATHDSLLDDHDLEDGCIPAVRLTPPHHRPMTTTRKDTHTMPELQHHPLTPLGSTPDEIVSTVTNRLVAVFQAQIDWDLAFRFVEELPDDVPPRPDVVEMCIEVIQDGFTALLNEGLEHHDPADPTSGYFPGDDAIPYLQVAVTDTIGRDCVWGVGRAYTLIYAYKIWEDRPTPEEAARAAEREANRPKYVPHPDTTALFGRVNELPKWKKALLREWFDPDVRKPIVQARYLDENPDWRAAVTDCVELVEQLDPNPTVEAARLMAEWDTANQVDLDDLVEGDQ